MTISGDTDRLVVVGCGKLGGLTVAASSQHRIGRLRRACSRIFAEGGGVSGRPEAFILYGTATPVVVMELVMRSRMTEACVTSHSLAFDGISVAGSE